MAVGSVGMVADMFALGAPKSADTKDKARAEPSQADVAKEKAEASAARQKSELAAIREKGIYAWAQEVKAEKIKEKIEQEIEARQGVVVADTPIPNTDAPGLEYEAVRQMREMLEAAMKSESQRAAAEGEPPKPMIIDISV
jgi:hypothetical protein